MAKAVPLGLDILKTPQHTPQAATPPRAVAAPAAAPATKPAANTKNVALQLKIPPEKAKAIRRAALDMNYPTVSEFMLDCYDAFMKAKG